MAQEFTRISLLPLKRLVKIDHTYLPNMENHKVYCKMYVQWKKLYAAQLALVNEGLTTPMWTAPGI